ncbi:phosphatase PAP2 family protein, partial [bacterium]|nr:phosphatase PAP2 family protein [bacterium]
MPEKTLILLDNQTRSIRQLLLMPSPALWFMLGYGLLFGIFLMMRVQWHEVHLFSFVASCLVWLAIHLFVNLNNFRLLSASNQFSVIFRSFFQVGFFYLPYLLISLIYDNLMLVKKLTASPFPDLDLTLMRVDAFLFGLQPTIWLQQLVQPLAVDFFMVAYSMFFIYPFCYLVYLIQKNQVLVFQRVLFAQILALATSLISFIIFPAMGPRVIFSPEYSVNRPNLQHYTIPLTGVHFPLIEKITGHPSLFSFQYYWWNYIEQVKTDCMPSMHTCLSLLCLFYVLKYRHFFKWRKTAVTFWITGITALIISTVYLRYHWVIDVILGALLAMVVFYLTEWIFDRWERNREQRGVVEEQVP